MYLERGNLLSRYNLTYRERGIRSILLSSYHVTI